jgi:hypothetical protein
MNGQYVLYRSTSSWLLINITAGYSSRLFVIW